jgi:hypothetical protein
MKTRLTAMTLGAAFLAILLPAQDSNPAVTLRALKDRAERGTLSDRRERVRGDTGKWNDMALLWHAPPVQRKPEGLSLDDWADQLADKKFSAAPNDDNWLVFRSRQLDDNDRIWVEKIERRGDEFTVILHEAIWQGTYRKTFTYYEVVAVNLGKLPAGKYSVKWLVTPLKFTQFEGPAQPKDGWPKDEQPGEAKPLALSIVFSVE